MAFGSSSVSGAVAALSGGRNTSGVPSRITSGAVSISGLSADATIAKVADSLLAFSRINLAAPIWVIIESPGSDLLMLASVFKVDAASTAYIGPGGVSTSIEEVQVPVPALTVNEIYCGCDSDPGAGTYTYTLMKNGSSTALTLAITGANRKGSLLSPVTFAPGDWLSLRISASGSAPSAHHNASLKITY